MQSTIDARATAILTYCISYISRVPSSSAFQAQHEPYATLKQLCDNYATLPTDQMSPMCWQRWFGGGAAQDKEIKDNFGADVERMRAGDLAHWRSQPLECLAGIIIMDQFTRNMYRGTKDMFCMDDQARDWAGHLRAQSGYEAMHPQCCLFVLLPFMHGETIADQEVCLNMATEIHKKLTAEHGTEVADRMIGQNLQASIAHKDIIEKWGRFPHRNEALGRESTPEEVAGLADGSIRSF